MGFLPHDRFEYHFSPMFEILKSMNEELFGRRWTDEDLRELATPRFGVVSGFASLTRDLKVILAQDLGDTPPAETHS